MKSVSIIRLDKIPITVPLNEGENIIGRGDKIQCFDRRVSRRHCKLNVYPNGHIELTQLHPNCSYYSCKGLGTQRLSSEKSIMLNEGDNFSLLSDEYKFQIEVLPEENGFVTNEIPGYCATVAGAYDPLSDKYESDASARDNLSDSSNYSTPLKRKSSTESSAKKLKTNVDDATAITESILAETVAAGLDLAEKDNWGEGQAAEPEEKEDASGNSTPSTVNDFVRNYSERKKDDEEEELHSASEHELD